MNSLNFAPFWRGEGPLARARGGGFAFGGLSGVTRFVQWQKHSMTGDHGAISGILEMTNKIEEQGFRSVHGEMVQVWSPNRDGIS
jgi:hypothetical protein